MARGAREESGMSFFLFSKNADHRTKKSLVTPASGSESGEEDRASVSEGQRNRIIPMAWGIGAAIAVAVSGFFLMAVYVISTWMGGVGIGVPFVVSSVAYGTFIALTARKRSSRQSATSTTIAMLSVCIASGAALITNDWLGGFGVIVSFAVTAVLYGILVARAVRNRLIDHLTLRATAAILLPILGSGVAIVGLGLDPFCTAEFADGVLLAIPIVAGCFAALTLLNVWMKHRNRKTLT